MPKLGVNIDHVATLRQARGGIEPDPIQAAKACERAGCDGIVVHLREDRRHINDNDLRALRKQVRTKLNLEMSCSPEIVGIARSVKPDQATLVPERRQELTTEGGLNVVHEFSKVKEVVEALRKEGIIVSIFVDPDEEQIRASSEVGAQLVELHTGRYANATNEDDIKHELTKLANAKDLAMGLGLRVAAGHGLNYKNVKPVAQIPVVEELNIGHAIISRAIFSGLEQAVHEMLELIR